MPARTTRQEARDRILKSFMDSLDRIIPPEESVPLRGKTFLDWAKQADDTRKAVLPTLLQERAARPRTIRPGWRRATPATARAAARTGSTSITAAARRRRK